MSPTLLPRGRDPPSGVTVGAGTTLVVDAETPSPDTRADATDDGSATWLLGPSELDAAPRTVLRTQVHLVSEQNVRLHKVVIAQQASLESARASLEHTREVARRATAATRTAIEHKKIAVKVARRERAERVRATTEHERARTALANAMALLRATTGDDGVPIDAARAPGSDIGSQDGEVDAARHDSRDFSGR